MKEMPPPFVSGVSHGRHHEMISPVVMSPQFHSTPPEAVSEIVRERVILDGRVFRLERPASVDGLFDHPAVQAAYAADEYIPYWAQLWPAGRMLAKAVLREAWPAWPVSDKSGQKRPRVLELGCGLGLAGIAALSCGFHVTFSDIDRLATKFAATNARLNGFDRFDTALIDFRKVPPGLQAEVILGSDLLYEARLLEPLVRFLATVLTPDGLALIADPDRLSARPFKWQCEHAGLEVLPEFARAGEPGGERTKGTVYRIRHRLPAAESKTFASHDAKP